MKAKVGDMNKSDQQLGDLWVRDAYDFGLWLYMLFKRKKEKCSFSAVDQASRTQFL